MECTVVFFLLDGVCIYTSSGEKSYCNKLAIQIHMHICSSGSHTCKGFDTGITAVFC